MRKKDVSMACPYYYTQANKGELLSEIGIKLFILNLKSIDDE